MSTFVPLLRRPHSPAPPAARRPLRPLRRGAAPVVRTKLKVGAVDAPQEREADRIAAAIVSDTRPKRDCCGSSPAVQHASGGPMIRRACAACEQSEDERVEPTIRRAPGPKSGPSGTPSPGVAEAIRRVQSGPSRPLPAAVRQYMEPRFGADFGSVRLRLGGAADAATRALGARAFTFGDDVAVHAADYRPETTEGRRLLAHELTHVLQQSDTVRMAPATPPGIPPPPKFATPAMTQPAAAPTPETTSVACDAKVPRALGVAIGRLKKAYETTVELGTRPGKNPLFDHYFGAMTPAGYNIVLAQLRQAEVLLIQAQSGSSEEIRVECHGAAHRSCASPKTNGFFHGKVIGMCMPQSASRDAEELEGTFVHEAVHATVSGEDDVYHFMRLFAILKDELTVLPGGGAAALYNPDSYAAYVLRITGVSEREALKDKPRADDLNAVRDPERRAAAERGLAYADGWVYAGHKAVDIQDISAIKEWSRDEPLRKAYLLLRNSDAAPYLGRTLTFCPGPLARADRFNLSCPQDMSAPTASDIAMVQKIQAAIVKTRKVLTTAPGRGVTIIEDSDPGHPDASWQGTDHLILGPGYFDPDMTIQGRAEAILRGLAGSQKMLGGRDGHNADSLIGYYRDCFHLRYKDMLQGA